MSAVNELEAPTCPLCSTNDRVARDTIGGRLCWLCTSCWTVFDGGPGEWEQNRVRRETHRRMRGSKQ